ncbi:hypothetical protein AB835_08630 [Candidatus Endobugula sertula]|uniref:Capsule polysaccharide biosynthesis protein n=1 Tax=Candidatus Endobugula sertula TaxID=62101 RepID=A0A1D2QPH6_9GAMM|nr:hypothetical protein AB835_08630 [Candidatus Endobugula sertula]
MLKSIKFALHSYKSIVYIVDLLKGIKKSYRDAKRLHYQQLTAWQEYAGKIMSTPLSDQQRGTAVIFGWSQFEQILAESIVRKSLELGQYRIKVLTSPTPFVQAAYAAMGVNDVEAFHSYCPIINQKEADSLVKTVTNFQDLIELEYDEVKIGKYISSTLMRRTRQGSLDLNNPTVKSQITSLLGQSIASIKGAQALVAKVDPQVLITVDRGYSPYGEVFDVFVNAGIQVITWNVAHRDNTIMFKRYNMGNRDAHPSSLSERSWEKLRELEWTNKHKETLYSELSSSYESGEWYGEVGTQFGKSTFDTDQIKNKLKLDKSKKTAIIFSHIFWDATFFWGEDLFRDYEDWFVQTVKAACHNNQLNWLIKVHPANTTKDRRDGIVGDSSEIIALREKIGPLPEHVKVIEADTEINTWSLFKVMDYCLTVRGTVGIEAGLLGKTVLTAGTGRYDHCGFTHDFDTPEEYLKCLASLHTIAEPTPIMNEMAQRYGYGVFVCRPLLLKSINLQFKQDSKASLMTDSTVKSIEELKSASDLKSLTDWIQSEDEDLLVL